MAEKMNIPEEEAYLRMLDQEVPDLWGRIEAGLGPEKKESREDRFLASQYAENVVPFDQGAVKNKSNKKRVWVIAGIAAAAAILIASLAIFGFGKRSTKDNASDNNSSDNTLNSYTAGNDGTDAASMKEEAKAESAEMRDDLDISGTKGDRNASYSLNPNYDKKKLEEYGKTVEQAEFSQGVTAGDGATPREESDEMQPVVTYIQAVRGESYTAKALAERTRTDLGVQLYMMKDGAPVLYRIARITYEGDVEIIPVDTDSIILTNEEYQAVKETIAGDRTVEARDDIIDGEVVYFIP